MIVIDVNGNSVKWMSNALDNSKNSNRSFRFLVFHFISFLVLDSYCCYFGHFTWKKTRTQFLEGKNQNKSAMWCTCQDYYRTVTTFRNKQFNGRIIKSCLIQIPFIVLEYYHHSNVLELNVNKYCFYLW